MFDKKKGQNFLKMMRRRRNCIIYFFEFFVTLQGRAISLMSCHLYSPIKQQLEFNLEFNRFLSHL